MNAHIRVAGRGDRDDIRDIHLQAFPEGEGESIAVLADNLLGEKSDPATFSLVAEMDGDVVGHVAFSPVYVRFDNRFLGYILAPLAVAPRHHKIGIGSQLVKSGIARVAALDANMLFVYGDPNYYGQFGFGGRAAMNFEPPYRLEYPSGWLGKMLQVSIGENTRPVRLSCVASLRDPTLW